MTWTGQACGPGRSWSRCGRQTCAPSWSWDAQTGSDAARLADEGYSVTAVDLSGEAIGQAQARFGSLARFLVADMTRRLPFPDGSFDAVMSNVAVHMFPDGVTRVVCTSSPRLTCANSWQDGSRCSWSRSRSRLARRVSRSSMSGAA